MMELLNVALFLAMCHVLLFGSAHGWPYGRVSCAPCQCYVESSSSDRRFRGRTADCTSQGLSDIPVYLPADIDHLILTNNSVLSIRENTLSNYRVLKTLQIDHNRLITIEPDVFESCPVMHYLDISGNDIQVLPETVFQKARILRELHGVQMQMLPSNIFNNLTQLRSISIAAPQLELSPLLFEGLFINTLDLELTEAASLNADILRPIATTLMQFKLTAPKITQLNESLFDDMVLLTTISITAPALRTLPGDLFHGDRLLPFDMTQLAHEVVADVVDSYLAPEKSMALKNVTLIGVQELPHKLFRQSPYLEHLKIHGSRNIPHDFLKNLRRLNTLDLTYNSLELLPEMWFDDLDGLKVLNLSHNHIQNLTHELLHLQSLQVLDLSFNNLEYIDGMAFTSFQVSIEELNLSHNSLTELKVGLFGAMWSLQTLDLSNNFIRDLPGKLFVDLQKLTFLGLHQNHLVELHEHSLHGLQNLEYLDIHDNYLTRLPPNALDEATFLLKLDLSQNDLQEVPVGTLSHHFLLSTVLLQGNQLVCGCGVEQLQALEATQGTNVSAQCYLYDNRTESTPILTDILEINVTVVCLQERVVAIDDRPSPSTRMPPTIPSPEQQSKPRTTAKPDSETESIFIPQQEAHMSTGSGNSKGYLTPLLWTLGCAFLLIVVFIIVAVVWKLRGVIFTQAYPVQERERQEQHQ